MDSQIMSGEESTATRLLKRNVAMYCMNTMRKRSIDEQLVDLSKIMESPLELKIVYTKTGLEVSYCVGSEFASVSGLDEPICVSQCKRDVLHKLKVFCGFTNNADRTSSSYWLARSDKYPESSSDNQGVYSEIELCKKRVSARTARNVFNENIVLVDPEMDISGELCDFMDTHELPLELTISYLQTECEITFECGPYSVSTKGSVHSTCTQPSKMLLLQELKKFVAEEVEVAQKESTNENQRCDALSGNTINEPAIKSVAQLSETANRIPVLTKLPVSNEQPRRSCNALEPHEKYNSRASTVLKTVSWDTVRESAKRFLDIIVQADRANQSYLKMITDCVVSNAIEEPEKCALYATLCCHVIEKASVASRRYIHQELSRAFKNELIQSCRDVLIEAGVMPLLRASQLPQGSKRSEHNFDLKARDRTQGTCRLMGEMFMRDQMFKTVMNTVDTFMQIHDAHSLECLCILLTIIGPKLETIIDAPRHVYEQLESFSVAGYAGNTPLPRRTIDMIDVVLNVLRYNPKDSNFRRGHFTGRNSRNRNSRNANKRHRQKVQSVDHRADRISDEISRYNQNQRSSTTSSTVQHKRKHVTFNPVVKSTLHIPNYDILIS